MWHRSAEKGEGGRGESQGGVCFRSAAPQKEVGEVQRKKEERETSALRPPSISFLSPSRRTTKRGEGEGNGGRERGGDGIAGPVRIFSPHSSTFTEGSSQVGEGGRGEEKERGGGGVFFCWLGGGGGVGRKRGLSTRICTKRVNPSDRFPGRRKEGEGRGKSHGKKEGG